MIEAKDVRLSLTLGDLFDLLKLYGGREARNGLLTRLLNHKDPEYAEAASSVGAKLEDLAAWRDSGGDT